MAKKKEKPTNYQLSNESSKTSQEFGYANRAASALKNALSPMVFGKYGNALHKQLLSHIIAVLNTGPTAKKGERTLADGDVALLKDMELNPYANFSSLTYSIFARVEIVPVSGEVKVYIPEISAKHFKWPERATIAYVHILGVVLDPYKMTLDCYALDPLGFSTSSIKQPPKKATIPVSDMDDQLLLVALGISFLRTDSEGSDGLISHNRKYYAAHIIEAAYVKDGKVMVFEKERKPMDKPNTLPSNAKTIKWDEQ